MKRKLAVCGAVLLAVCGLSGCKAESSAPAADAVQESAAGSADDGWKAQYKAILEQYEKDTAPESDRAWDLRDLDNDGTPELLISEGNAHIAGLLIYYYENGRVTAMQNADGQLLHYGAYGKALMCPEEHLLGINSLHMGYAQTTMDSYEGHSLTRLQKTGDSSGAFGEELAEYTVNEVKVPKEEWQRAIDLFESKNWTEIGTQYRLGEYAPLA